MRKPAQGGVSAESKSDNLILAESSLQTQDLEARSPQIQADFHQLKFLEADTATVQLDNPCSSCNANLAIQVAGTGPHYAALRCACCDRFIKWLPKPRGAA